jgi:hypothetical protein
MRDAPVVHITSTTSFPPAFMVPERIIIGVLNLRVYNAHRVFGHG